MHTVSDDMSTFNNSTQNPMANDTVKSTRQIQKQTTYFAFVFPKHSFHAGLGRSRTSDYVTQSSRVSSTSTEAGSCIYSNISRLVRATYLYTVY